MPFYEVEYTYTIPMFGTLPVKANNKVHAEDVALETLSNTIDDDFTELTILEIIEKAESINV